MKNMKKKRKKMNKNKKMKIEGDEDEETRAEIENGMKPVLELKKLLKEPKTTGLCKCHLFRH